MQRFHGFADDPKALFVAEIGKLVGISPVGPAGAIRAD
jgi:hypothetical protein